MILFKVSRHVQIKIITAGRPSKVIRPIHPGTDFVGLATNTDRHAIRCMLCCPRGLSV